VNNSPAPPLHWSRLFGLCPVVVIGLTLSEAVLFGATLLLTLILTTGCMAFLQRWIVAAQRPIVNALLATVVVAILDLLLQATCYQHAQNLQLFLPLLAIVAVLLYKNEAAETSVSAKSLGHALSNAARVGALFGATLIIFSVLRTCLPADGGIALSLVGSGLLLATAIKLYPDASVTKPPVNSTRVRARVTGPVR